MEEHKNAFINLAIESWRMARVFDRALTKLDAGEKKRYIAKLRWFIKKIDESLQEAGMRIVNVEGHPYDPGMAATPLNIEDFEPDAHLVVEQMLETDYHGRGKLS